MTNKEVTIFLAQIDGYTVEKREPVTPGNMCLWILNKSIGSVPCQKSVQFARPIVSSAWAKFYNTGALPKYTSSLDVVHVLETNHHLVDEKEYLPFLGDIASAPTLALATAMLRSRALVAYFKAKNARKVPTNHIKWPPPYRTVTKEILKETKKQKPVPQIIIPGIAPAKSASAPATTSPAGSSQAKRKKQPV